jgi:transposase
LRSVSVPSSAAWGVQASELQEALRCIKQMEGALRRKTLDDEILKTSVDFAKEKSGLRACQN